MRRKNGTGQSSGELKEKPYEEDIHFDWKDIVAFTIAIYQVLFPYVLFIFGGIGVVALLFYFLFR